MNEDHPRGIYSSASETIARESAAATAQLAEMTKAYHDRPEAKLDRDREALERMRNDPSHLNRRLTSLDARNEEAFLAARIRDAENQIAADRGRVTLDPKLDPAAARRVSYGQQVPIDDFEDAVETLLEHGVRPTLVESFLQHGHGDNTKEDRPFEQDRAEEWLRKLTKLLAKDPEIMRQFACYGMHAADPRRG
jgi:hypothetical protein